MSVIFFILAIISCSSRLKVNFQRSVAVDMRFGGRSRVKIVNTEADDLGGLLVEWFDDFFEALKTHTVMVNLFASSRINSSEAADEDDGDEAWFPLFRAMGNARHFLPSRLMSKPVVEGTEGEVISLTTAVANKEADKQRKALVSIYETTGKMLNQMLREDIPLPEAFSSPLLILFLLGGSDGIRNKVDFSCEELMQTLLEVDYETFGLIGSTVHNQIALLQRNKSTFCKELLFDEIVRVHVLEPRLEALMAMKRGFDLFPIAQPLLEFPWTAFCRQFVSLAFVNSADLMSILVFKGQTVSFETVVRQAVASLNPDQCMSLLKFATGFSHFHATVQVQVVANVVEESPMLLRDFPDYPLTTSLTCSCQLFVPCPVEPSSFFSSSSSSSSSAKSISKSSASPPPRLSKIFTANNVVANLLNSFANGNDSNGDFSDRGAGVTNN